jgi:hypothetical protein
LALSGEKTWLPINGSLSGWNGNHTIFRIYFDPNGVDTPTVWPGDTIYPDSTTITDLQGRPCIHPVVLEGSFNPGIEEEKAFVTLPRKLELLIHPNPCWGNASIFYDIPLQNAVYMKTSVTIELYDLSGRRVKSIVSRTLFPGTYSNVLDDKSIRQGIYFIRLTTPQASVTKKLIFLH